MSVVLTAFFIIVKIVIGAQVNNCPRDQVKFEKIIGLRPSNAVSGYLLHKNDHYEPVTLECLTKCSTLEACRSFVVYYNISQCNWYSYNLEGLQENENVIDSDVAWFSKTCLIAPDNCIKSWIFERMPGFILIGNNAKTLSGKITREECQQHCLNETEIQCKSAKFKIYDELNTTETRGVCTLSDSDRHFNPNAYRASSYNEEYFENQCTNVTRNEFCAYEEYENVMLTHIDLKFEKTSKSECEEQCYTTNSFNCRGYSLVPVDSPNDYDSDINTCFIHSENSKTHGPRLLQYIEGATFYEKARCINVTVTCTESLLIVRYKPDVDFNGKIYMSGYSNNLECYAIGRNKEMVQLKIPLFDNQCGVTEARSTNNFNRTLLSGNMIIQNHPIIQTQGDRLLRVGCVFSNDSKIVLGTGVNFNSTASSNVGTTIINSTTIHPVVEMRIVDYFTQTEVADSQIGQELQLIIEIKPHDGPYDIWAAHLVAMTDDVNNSILLLDDQGCPTNEKIFPALYKIYNNQTRRLVANFQAFKFSSSSIVRFSVVVQFCPRYCAPVNCENNIPSNTRNKRDATRIVETLNGSTVVPINKHQYENQGKSVAQLPLELVLVVRNTKPMPDRLVYGESKLLVAGYDYISDEVCLNYSLFIGLIITWVLMQIILVTVCVLIIRHYKKYYEYQQSMAQSLEALNRNFGLGFSNLEPRRVHWADNDDFT